MYGCFVFCTSERWELAWRVTSSLILEVFCPKLYVYGIYCFCCFQKSSTVIWKTYLLKELFQYDCILFDLGHVVSMHCIPVHCSDRALKMNLFCQVFLNNVITELSSTWAKRWKMKMLETRFQLQTPLVWSVSFQLANLPYSLCIFKVWNLRIWHGYNRWQCPDG